MSVTFTPSVGDPVTVTPVPGSLSYGDGHDDRGGGLTPNARAGLARNGSCEVVIDDAGLTVADAYGLVSGVGEGDYTITGDDIDTDMHSYHALLDVEIKGDAVQIASISWKGTIS